MIAEPEGHIRVRQAFDGETIQDVKLSPWAEIDDLLGAAERLHRDATSRLPIYRRIDILRRLSRDVAGESEDYALLIAREGGKPLLDARVEVARAVNGIEIAISALEHLHGAEIPMELSAGGADRLAFTRQIPIGPVVAVSAFNHPLNLIVHQVVPAVAAGCPVIVKPADTTPLSCLKFVEALYKAGLPEGWCRAVVADIPTAERLVTDPRVAFFSFIGSAKVGWHLRSKLAPGTRCALEHGGAAPVIVAADADLDRAVPLITKGGYYHAGQVCVSAQRIFVANGIKDRFVDALKHHVGEICVGNPIKSETEVGPLILPREVGRVGDWVREAISGGATCPLGGHSVSERVYAPTILVEPPVDAKVSTLEIFGPVTCIYGFEDLTQAVAQANDLAVAFQAAVFTSDIDVAFDLSNRLEASAVMINDHSAFRVDWMPFAGLKQSGLGVGGIGHMLKEMTIEKMTVIRCNRFLA